MFGLSWGEMMVVGIVALIVIGPKDLPQLFRTMGEFTGKAKAMAREFSRAMNDAAKDSGVNDISKTIKAAANPKAFGVDKIKEATGAATAAAALSPERAAARDQASEAMAKAANERIAREKAAASAKSEQEKAPAVTPASTDAAPKDTSPKDPE